MVVQTNGCIDLVPLDPISGLGYSHSTLCVHAYNAAMNLDQAHTSRYSVICAYLRNLFTVRPYLINFMFPGQKKMYEGVMDIIKIPYVSMHASSRLHQDIQDTKPWQNVAMLVAFTNFEVRAAPYFACLSHQRLGLLLSVYYSTSRLIEFEHAWWSCD